jgi:SAM-dependent methyltransferase
MRRTVCGGCGSDELHRFLDLGMSPIADAYTATADEKSTLYPLELAVCTRCRLVQLLEVVDSATLFGTGYSFYSSASPPLSDYHRRYAEQVLHTASYRVTLGVVEVGCNDGDMLRWLAPHARWHLGVDPAEGPITAALKRGLNVLQDEFSLEVAKEIRDMGFVGVVVANHVLAHVEDVSDVLAGIAHLLDEDGVAFVEVQYLPDLLVNNAFDVVYHEHRNFFSLTSLAQVARQVGLYVDDVELTRRQGGSMRVTLTRELRDIMRPRVCAVLESEWWLNAGTQAYDGLQGRVERVRERLLDALAEVGAQAGYGAPAKATTLLNYCGIRLTHVVDTTKAKQGRFIPGTGIPIIGPEYDDVSAYLLLAWNYAHEIVKSHRPSTRWVIPLPAPLVL